MLSSVGDRYDANPTGRFRQQEFRNLGSPDMESTKSGHYKVAGQRGTPGNPAGPSHGRVAKTDPRSRAVNRSSRADRHASFADEILRDLDPRGSLERLVADHVVHSAWKLKANLETQSARDRLEKSDPDAEPPKGRIRSTELDRNSRSLRDSLEFLDYLRTQTKSAPAAPFAGHFLEGEILPNEWPIVPCDGLDDLPGMPDEPVEEATSWQDRLVFDFDVSDVSPVVKGTWITVGHVVSLIVDGWTWADILRSHPELTEDDIRTCVAYAMAEENSAA
jgi:uncharacterized protein (DUF433 family)